MTRLPPYPGDPDSAATAINDLGQVIGISGLCSNAVGGMSAIHALLWENGRPMNLGNLGGQEWNTPISLNNNGQVVGFGNNALGNAQAFLWTQEGRRMQALPFLGDDNASAAYDINEEGQIVGISNGGTEPFGERAFLYENGKMMDLNDLVQNSSLYLLIAQGINDRGEIVGTAVDASGQQVGFLAVPAYGESEAADFSKAASDNNSRDVVPPSGFRPHLSGFSRMLFEGTAK
jgi:probable HAF family extracellular repeat protein